MADTSELPPGERMGRGRSRRLTKEAKMLEDESPYGCHIQPASEDLRSWEANILGPEGSPYEDGIFYMKIIIPEEYPFKPPQVNMTTEIYHAFINEEGRVHLPILCDSWHPRIKVSDVVTQVRNLLSDPSICDGHSFNRRDDAFRLYQEDRIKYNETAREWTLKYASN